MRNPIIAGNWKMNMTIAEATALVREMRRDLNNVEKVDKVLCPPFTALAAVSELLRASKIKLGAQDMHWEEKGAYTGAISPSMVRYPSLTRWVTIRSKSFGSISLNTGGESTDAASCLRLTLGWLCIYRKICCSRTL